MTEWEKMISGQLYNAEVPQLQAMRRRAAELCHRLELLSPDQAEQRQAILRELLGSAKGSFTINPGFRCDYGRNITTTSEDVTLMGQQEVHEHEAPGGGL